MLLDKRNWCEFLNAILHKTWQFFFLATVVVILHLSKIWNIRRRYLCASCGKYHCYKPLLYQAFKLPYFSVNVQLYVNCSLISHCSYTVCFCVLSRNLWKGHPETHLSVLNDALFHHCHRWRSLGFSIYYPKKVLSDESGLNIFRLIICPVFDWHSNLGQ